MSKRWIPAPVSSQATSGATSVERSCSRGPDESVLSLPRLRRCGTGRGRPTGRFTLFNDIASRSPIGDPAGREGVNMVIRSLTVYFGIPGRTLIAYLSVSREHGTRGGISGNGYVRVDRVMIFFHDQEIARTRVTYSTQHNPGTAPDMWHHGSSAAGRRRKCW